MSHKYVYLFSEGNGQMRELLGGKGANLAEMTSLGMPVPQGFTITTEACTQYYKDDHQINADIEAEIICEKESHKGIVIGKGGQMLKRIGTSARIEIENLMDTKVNLKLWVKVRKEWRDSELYMKNYGYNSKDI